MCHYGQLSQRLTSSLLPHRGQTPADAEFNFLDHAKRLDMYGVDLHKAKVRDMVLETQRNAYKSSTVDLHKPQICK